ncbi:uncharacterized protein KY384_008057 [Bacidia gigantensis]|uniref:uncharacterized protein n=1 Tax=Bacidia gigantensis TaxID=2732470 RepID=UPI001D03929E|nr:uncharacterized protein KY384_008057 [Bacidia gigantensis]KAG8527313.1 hypothetical protein KY384_008057 [Bacidia gigantensis]
MPDGSTIETVAGGGLTPFTSNKQMHMFDPDAAITLIDAHKNKPFMLFEVATSQTAINLQRKVKDYLNGSHGWTTLIFTMNVEQDEVPDRNPIMQDFNFEVEVSRTWRPNIGPDERYTPEPVRFYQATRRFDPDQQDEPGFPGSIRVYRQDLWARRKTDPPPGDLITIEMSSFGKDAKKALKFALIDMVHSARTSIDSKQDDIDTASSEGSGPAAPPDSPVDDKKVDKTFKGGARPSNVQDGLARKTRSKGPVD